MNAAELVSELAARTNFSAAIFTVALLMCRVMPVLIFSPFLGGEVVPTEMKMGIGLTLAIVLYPSIAHSVTTIPLSALPYIALMAKEIFIGFSMAFVVNGVFEAARIAGTLADTMSGSNNAQLYVPQLGQQVSLFSNLKVQLSVVLFLTLDGHHLVIRALADSLTTVPLDGFPRFSQGSWTFFDVLIRVFADMLRVSLALAAPATLAAFLTDVALGAINRVAPQIQVFFISMAIKPLVGVLITFLVLGTLIGRIQDELAHMLKVLHDALRLLA
ncbi:flagellar biosynthetic protein FliR [Myxococcus sp. MISCRS1]|jgi:flagellar biosynthetic protein FliR|uniref:Flagellar biosynthetic protein FliR n=1 Tax=Myxococcus fulvus TaxID=33 RepID=A0A511T3S1_MYXFU|nr:MULTISPECIES: flagellar biosynthetic protein FliR [Myxococcus]AKF80759.1 flagellar biosynthesis protein FliR [Myxococcus fulvus 124B02]BDT33332.1 flagellar biosynthetic protein FliR [Myxococcus sp. MH1]MBZ4397040.1 flagellar biosynthetic protein FliR [Myxococcus sp. AS-1-15]MBZ4408234.1 flagellar biosynthetic protein FliR [Myxococcus sp. XM-1-1-1]MCY0996651.1 flagellar biosynthetic protein FliR [Myxococcus sp. MISCRS1]